MSSDSSPSFYFVFAFFFDLALVLTYSNPSIRTLYEYVIFLVGCHDTLLCDDDDGDDDDN